jgi:glycerol-3-phosphate acyltransferase PlsX
MAQAVVESLDALPPAVQLILCGEEKPLHTFAERENLKSLLSAGRLSIAPAQNSSVTGSPSRFYKEHPRSSLVTAIELQRTGVAQLSLSAGDTGALLSSSVFMLGKEEGVERPALAATFPCAAGGVVLILDVGANLVCRASHLVDFSYLGASFMKKLSGRSEPVVRLLNVGREEYKGTTEVKQAHAALLQKDSSNYGGFIEGNRVLTGDADVVVCNGFAGNALLKLSEGIFRFVKKEFYDDFTLRGKKKIGRFDSELYGAVPILGVQGNVYKAHGNSSVTALVNALTMAGKTLYL